MSRCFPYPPPGYARKVARTEAALIESIKLQSERREHRADRKKEKKSKDRKEKKSKDRKEKKSKDKKEKKIKDKKHKEKSSRSLDSGDHELKKGLKEAKDLPKGTKVEAEQLERSSLTEEHGQPVWPQSPGYLSDGTQITHKRKRDATLQPNEGCKLGKIIRIKLSSSLSQKEDSLASKEPKCSTSGRDHLLDQQRDENRCGPIHPRTCLTNADAPAVVVKDPTSSKVKISLINSKTAVVVNDPTSSKLKIEDPCAIKNGSSQVNVVSLPPRTKSPAKSAHVALLDKLAMPSRSRSCAESAYEALFDKWAPPLLQLEQQTDDEDWLFGTTNEARQSTNKPSSPAPSCRSSSLWPRGQYLADADVYSLPYTIPF